MMVRRPGSPCPSLSAGVDDQIELLQRRLARERAARKQAEQIADEKSRELYINGQDLERTALSSTPLR
ncbi:MAG TPA: hypothetical protein VFD74_05460 [Thermoleophilia bacterium]|nr:hypothetical protein [Thermoleophilia bacterium]